MNEIRGYKPEDPLQAIGSFADIQQMIREIVRSTDPEVTDLDLALASEILRKFGNSELVGRFGVREIIERIDTAIRFVRPRLRTTLKQSVSPEFRGEVELENDVGITSEPGVLMSFVRPDETPENDSDSISRVDLRSKHACMILALGILGFIAEACDDPRWIARDVPAIGALTVDRLFRGNEMKNILIVASKHKANHKPNPGSVRVFPSNDKESADSYADQLTSKGSSIFRTRYLCNSHQFGTQTFYVLTGARGKELWEIIGKQMRADDPKSFLKDNRGLRHIVVAVQESGGPIKPATRNDAMTWANILLQNIWRDEAFVNETEPIHNKAKSGSRNYWDIKILGRYLARHDGLLIAGRVEQQILTIGDFLASNFGADEENHLRYELSRFYEHILPKLFPHFNWKLEERRVRNEEHIIQVTHALNGVR